MHPECQLILLVVKILLLFMMSLSLGCVTGTIYTVADSSGWDISSDLDSWVQPKTFVVGDSLREFYVIITYISSLIFISSIGVMGGLWPYSM